MTETTLLSRLAASLRECSEDLAAEVDVRYGADQKAQLPWAYARDMAPVERARALLAEWEEKKQRWREAPP